MYLRRSFFAVLFFIILSNQTFSQQINLRGTVTDATTGESLPFVNVILMPALHGIGTMTDDDGKYSLSFSARGDHILFSCIGYEQQIIPLKELNPRAQNTRHIKLKPIPAAIKEIVVKTTRTRYTNRDNPAVELMRRVIANKEKNRLEAHDSYEYERYEKIQLGLNGVKDSLKNIPVLRRFPILYNYIDTSKLTGGLSLPIFLRENISVHYFSKQNNSEKEVLFASRMAHLHDLIEEEALSVFLDGMVARSNIYDNQIAVLENEYMSPMSPMAPNFYRFHIIDTIDVSGISCIWLSVYPRNAQDFGFRGNMYITNDGNFALKRAELSFTQNTNVNFVNNFSLIQEYTQIDSAWCLTLDEAALDFGLTGRQNWAIGKRSNIYTKYRFDHDIPETTFAGIHQITKAPDFDERPEQYWQESRPVSLSRSEQGVYNMIDEVKEDRILKHVLSFSGFIYSGYIGAGKVDFGPVESFFSFNDVEGGRLRFGGKTNAHFNKHFFLEGYAAYGLKDEKLKYRLGAMYSFRPHKQHQWEYPMNLLYVFYENNIETPGQFFLFGNADRLFTSLQRGNTERMIYYQTFVINYEREFLSGFAIKPSFTRRSEQAGGALQFNSVNGNNINSINTTQLALKLRFAPNERFYQAQHNRYTLNHTNPVITVNYIYALKLPKNNFLSMFDSDYGYHRLETSIDKRTWFSSFGYSDMSLKAGKIWGTLPFPLLIIHQANQSYAYRDEACNLMNYMEFISDHYAQMHLSHCLNGVIFNRLPLIKKLKLREFVTFKALWGGIEGKNRPENDHSLFPFPVNDIGDNTVFMLGRQPYMEAGFAIDNLFKFFRIDIIKRLNYLDHPNVAEWGIRFKYRFVF